MFKFPTPHTRSSKTHQDDIDVAAVTAALTLDGHRQNIADAKASWVQAEADYALALAHAYDQVPVAEMNEWERLIHGFGPAMFPVTPTRDAAVLA